MQVSYELISAVQDLYDLYLRNGPSGPYRMELFHGATEQVRRWPEPLRRDGDQLDKLIRGVSCLMANDLAEAALPLIAEVWRSVRRIEKRISGRRGPEPGYFSFISFELSMGPPAGEPGVPADRSLLLEKAYRLFAEVLSVYLDTICLIHGGDSELTERVVLLRRKIGSAAGRS